MLTFFLRISKPLKILYYLIKSIVVNLEEKKNSRIFYFFLEVAKRPRGNFFECEVPSVVAIMSRGISSPRWKNLHNIGKSFLIWWWSAEIFPVEYGRILKRNSLGKLLKISPRSYRHEYQRFVNAQFPIFSHLRMTRGRLARITNFRWSILNFVLLVNLKFFLVKIQFF